MQPTLIRYEDLAEKGIHFSRMHLRRLMKANRFPRHVDISANRIGWYEHEIDEWIRSLADRRQPSAA